jgi:hypothetical protein
MVALTVTRVLLAVEAAAWAVPQEAIDKAIALRCH